MQPSFGVRASPTYGWDLCRSVHGKESTSDSARASVVVVTPNLSKRRARRTWTLVPRGYQLKMSAWTEAVLEFLIRRTDPEGEWFDVLARDMKSVFAPTSVTSEVIEGMGDLRLRLLLSCSGFKKSLG